MKGWLLVVIFLLSSQTALAASLYIDPAKTSLDRGDAITLKVRLDVDEAAGECVNAVDGVVTFTKNISVEDVSVGDSIFNVWIEPPQINKEDNTVTFAGGIPNGYCGRIAGDPRLSNVIAKLVVRSPGFIIGGGDETIAYVNFSDKSTAYLNDGRGTKAILNTYGSTIELNSKPGSVIEDPWREEILADVIPPAQFSISLQKDEKAFSQKYYIVFNTSDKETGIDHYEVMEEPLTQFGSFQWGRADAPWVRARSPYILADQSLNSIIRVKALDKAGNEYIATLIPDETMRTLSHSQITTLAAIIAGAVLVFALGFVGLWLWKRRKAASMRSLDDNVDTNESSNDNYGE